MFESFTDGAKQAIVHAQEEARALNHNYLGTEHLLLGLIQDGSGAAATVLAALGCTPTGVRQQVESSDPKGHDPPRDVLPFTPRAKKVLDLGRREAMQLGHGHVRAEHLLMGLVREGEGVGARVLTTLGVDLGHVHRQLRLWLISGGPSADVLGAAAVPSAPPPDAAGRLAAIETTLNGVLDRLTAIEDRLAEE